MIVKSVYSRYKKWMILIVSSSHHSKSRSRLLAQAAEEALQKNKITTDFLDLRKHPLPHSDGETTYEDPTVIELQQRVHQADGILLATPVYNYDANSVAKSFIEHTGREWQGKPVGLLATAGGKGSYMALLPLAGSLILDFHCHILPQQVYGTGEQFSENSIIDMDITKRVETLCKEMIWFTQALRERK